MNMSDQRRSHGISIIVMTIVQEAGVQRPVTTRPATAARSIVSLKKNVVGSIKCLRPGVVTEEDSQLGALLLRGNDVNSICFTDMLTL